MCNFREATYPNEPIRFPLPKHQPILTAKHMEPHHHSRSVSPSISRRALDAMSGGLDSESANIGIDTCVSNDADFNRKADEPIAFTLATGSNPLALGPHTMHPATMEALHTVANFDYSSITLPNHHLSTEQLGLGLEGSNVAMSSGIPLSHAVPTSSEIPLSYAVPEGPIYRSANSCNIKKVCSCILSFLGFSFK